MGDLLRAGPWVALACGAWTLVLGWEAPTAALLAAPVVAVGIWLLPRRPRLGTAVVLLASALALVAGAPYGAVDTVVPLGVALFVLGRLDGRSVTGLAAVVLAACCEAFRDGPTPGKLVVVLLLNATPWAFGTVVARRAADARAAVAEAALLAREDPRVVAHRRAAAERVTLAARAVAALSAAIHDMRAAARDGVLTLAADDVRLVHERGAAAVDELRSLLGLLRLPAEPEPAPVPAAPRRAARPALAAVPLVVLALAAVARVAAPTAARAPETLVLHVTCILAVAVRGLAPGLACVLAALGSLPVAFHAPDVPEVLLPAAAAYATLAWNVAVRSRPSGWAGLGVLAVAGVGASLPHGPHGAGFVLVVLGFGAASGSAWAERDRILREAGSLAAHLRTQIDDASDEAVRAERLRLARELHDVASHSVGAMVLQAGAAQAQRDRDPERAREALRTVVSLAEQALADVTVLDDTLGTGRGSGNGPADAATLRTALDRLLGAAVADEQRVEADLGDLPGDPARCTVILRVVAESLTNAARHAPGAQVRVRARPTPDGYVVTVSDDGAATETGPGAPRPGTGFGLAGLAERVGALGGTFRAGPGGDGGFVVEAVLPATGTGAGAPPERGVV